MPFSASTCLTNTGTTSLGPTLYFYSDVDGYASSFGSTSTTNLIGGNCPHLITGIPDSTSIIRLFDPTTNCCASITIQSNDLCVTCDLDFTVYSSTTASQIIAGTLTGSCSAITDYVIYWYGPNSTTNVGYISGEGTSFPYNFTHPLTGNSAIFAQAGDYVPVIDKIIVSGLTFSQTGGTGYYLGDLDCFEPVPVTVLPLNCDNGNQNSGNYSHSYNFSGASVGLPPQPLDVTFELSITTNYFAFLFDAFTVSDTLKITFSGTNYSEPITLEHIETGPSIGTNFVSFPKLGTPPFYRILTLTGLTRSVDDFLTISVTPNSGNSSTNWLFSCQCLSGITCDTCFDNYANSPYPIIGSSITGVTGVSCNTLEVSFDVSGCSASAITPWDVDKYVIPNNSMSGAYLAEANSKTNNATNLRNRETELLFFNLTKCNRVTSPYTFAAVCSPVTANTITYEKGVSGGQGFINITCDNYSDFLSFWNNYQSIYASFSGDPTNNLNPDYYRYAILRIPLPLTNNCGDGTTFTNYNIHFSSVVTSGGTGPWTMSLTMPTITAATYSPCDIDCTEITTTGTPNFSSAINTSSTGTSNNISGTTYTGSRATLPFIVSQIMTSGLTNYTAHTIQAFFYISNSPTSEYPFNTLPWSGVSNTYIPSQSGQTCSTINYAQNGNFLYKFQYYYIVSLINPLDVGDFEISATTWSNGAPAGYPSPPTYVLAYQYSGGTVTYSDPTYIV